jgi:NADH-quinone oxidoreductase subunit M
VWISALGIHYKLGLDGLNIALVVLTTVLFSASLVWSAFREWDRPRIYYFFFGLAESGVLLAFCSQDLALFVAAFDLMLIPFYFLIGMWGTGPDRIRATTKLVVYTLVGSFFMLAAAIATGVLASSDHHTSITFVLSALHGLPLSHTTQEWIFGCFAVAFLVKMPLVPFHGWLADGYKAMPIPAVAVFSAILSKVAAYGFLRIVLPLFPYAAVHYQTLMLLICLVSILWATSVAFTTPDARLVVAYSSVAQLGFITLGIFSLRPEGGQGALLQMVNHGLVTAPAFFIVATLAARAGGSEMLRDMGGMAMRAPVLAALFLIVALATLAMPGSSNFAGEFLILLGTFKSKLVIASIAFLGVVGAAVYALRLFISAMHNRPGVRVGSREILIPEMAAIAPLVLVILALAFYPQFVLRRTEPSVQATVGATASHPLTVASR